jgi:hypothetical protein
MQVAVDTNILLADPWFEGQKMRALLDFVDRTRSELLIHAVVAEEFRAVLERQWRGALTEIEGAVRKARRLGLQAPDVDIEASIEAARTAWEQRYRRIKWQVKEIGLEPSLLPEALRRSANRIPPCARSGEEIRDALLWLGLMKYSQVSGHREIAFISQNSRDFCGPDAGKLHPDLISDTEELNVTLHFYTSLDDFLRDHAKPIEHLTPAWVLERIDIEEVQQMIERYMHLRDADEYHKSWSYEEWAPSGYPRVTTVNPELTDVYVWEYAPDEPMTLFLNFSTYIEAEVTAEREEGDPEWGYHTDTREIPLSAERNVEIAATVDGDKVHLVEIEHVEKM